MSGFIQTACLLILVAGEVDTKFVQLHPAPTDALTIERSPERTRAVVLIHGLRAHPFHSDSVKVAQFHGWQKPGATIVQILAKDSDVFAFAYSQNVAVCAVAEAPVLGENIQRLRDAGYTEIVLVGHSAGGLVARQFVEDRPDAGVTKVVQVCAPNGGASLAKLGRLVREEQEPFVQSLTKDARRAFCQARADKKAPATVQFICIVGDGGEYGDGVVRDHSQWAEDLQEQGVPAVRVRTTHFTAMRSRAVAERLAELIRQDCPRCDTEAVAKLKKEILGK